MPLPALKIGNIVARIPIIQGGMGVGISLSGLASAVAEEGGIGVIATAMIGMNEPDIYANPLRANIRALKREIRKAREMTRGILGVNIMVALTNFADMVKTSIEEGIDLIFSGAGLPLDLPGYLKNMAATKLVPIVSSARAARIICKKWRAKFDCLPDALVVEGPKAGGHLGFKPEQLEDPHFALENLVPEVIEAVKPFEEKYHRAIPVIAAGGIYTGADICKFLRMGAAGVQMGTRFVATHECDADQRFKQAYIEAREEDLVVINSPVGLPGRAIRNEFITEVERGKTKPFKCPYQCLTTCDYKKSPYCIAFALMSAKKGNLKHGFAFAGQNAYRVEKITSVKELISSLLQEYETAAAQENSTASESTHQLTRIVQPSS
ncbi:MAG: nitronate monooxygenase [Deltaproteobacteria bacterium]|nr:nitronate monooxygenase [Deltaproteobacteria bacterium]MBW2072276.1 nitronate monooxygenase [Deltaproteobacteria bacterium]